MHSGRAGDVPLVWMEPEEEASTRTLVIWLPGFSGTKEMMQRSTRWPAHSARMHASA